MCGQTNIDEIIYVIGDPNYDETFPQYISMIIKFFWGNFFIRNCIFTHRNWLDHVISCSFRKICNFQCHPYLMWKTLQTNFNIVVRKDPSQKLFCRICQNFFMFLQRVEGH